MRNKNRWIWIIITFALLPILWSQIFIHDWYLWRFSHNYAGIVHPPTTQHIKGYKELGLLIGNGNHIDLFAGEVRSYSGSREQVIKWYKGKSVPSILTHGALVSVEIVFIENGALPHCDLDTSWPYTLDDIVDDMKTFAVPDRGHLYIVYVFVQLVSIQDWICVVCNLAISALLIQTGCE